jgi:hypothetical protein
MVGRGLNSLRFVAAATESQRQVHGCGDFPRGVGMRGSRTWMVQQIRTIVNLACGAVLLAPIAVQANEYTYFDEAAPAASLAEPMTPSATTLRSSPNSHIEATDETIELAPAPADAAAKKKLQAAVAGAYKGVFYDNNFDYLCNPAYDDYHLGEGLKRICLHDGYGILDIGGEYRARYHHEHNIRGLGLTGNDDDFLLHRTRVYANYQLGERLRFYAEYIDAESNYEDYAPRPIEVNRSDMLNLFGDATIFDNDYHGRLVGRVGRQELLYGDQRLISPLDWANTRRTFDGAKLMWTYEDWKVDGFWTKPVIVNPRQFDSPDENQQFYGLYSTYSGIQNHVLDFYWIGYQSELALYPGTQPFHFQTVGSRWSANWGCWQTIAEGAYQFGDYGPFDHSAGFFTLGAGHKWDDLCWKPEFWAYYDWASGDDVIGNGFNQLFPLGHKYLGFMDLFGRSNIEDINFTLSAQPHQKLKALLWWHIFFLEDGNDVPYNVNGRPFVTTPGGDRYLGQELDVLFTYAITPRAELLFGYSHFFTGDWYRTNPDAPFSGDAEFFYTQFSQKF